MILLDDNILLEIIISGRAHKDEVLDWMSKNTQEFCISMLSVHLILHFGLLDNLTINQLKSFLADYPKIALLPDDYSAALSLLRNKDHEDALQLAVAERTGCSAIVTLDKNFAKAYKDRINFISPLPK